ncbi:MAG: carbohydrate-binding family 9-like protein, partial [Oligoflexales bacterium]|nr:carbohydrate-binding family 9-like protein [Oligoflexales bacterium]
WNGRSSYRTFFKSLYSDTGIYFAIVCEDMKISSSFIEDFSDLFREDVVEVFLWPDESQSVYFEYEISPLDCELPLLVSNCRGKFHGWLPWNFKGERKTRHATSCRGGRKASFEKIDEWTAEFFIPFALLKGLSDVPPVKGSCWRMNVCRIDYDEKPESHWAWDDRVKDTFHDIGNFGSVVFV